MGMKIQHFYYRILSPNEQRLFYQLYLLHWRFRFKLMENFYLNPYFCHPSLNYGWMLPNCYGMQYLPQFFESTQNFQNFPTIAAKSDLDNQQSYKCQESSEIVFSEQDRPIVIKTLTNIKIVNQNYKKPEQVKRKNRYDRRIVNQKESRNVFSNLLRLFFKNILETHSYDTLIETAIAKLKLSITSEQFFSWLSKKHINFKNYLRISFAKPLFIQNGGHPFSVVMRVLLNDFLHKYCINHSLTSKRIGGASIRMHLNGVRELRKQLMLNSLE